MATLVRKIPSAGFTQGTWLDQQSCALGRMISLVREGNPNIEVSIHTESGRPVVITSDQEYELVKVHYVSLDNVLCVTVR